MENIENSLSNIDYKEVKFKLNWLLTDIIFEFYSLPIYEIEKTAKICNWKAINRNPNISFTKEFIEKYKDEIDFDKISLNNNMKWSADLVEKYESRLNFRLLSHNKSLPWSKEFLTKYIDKFDWSELALNYEFPWTIQLIELYADKIDWNKFSANQYLPWSLELINQFCDKWCWWKLSENESIPWSEELLKAFSNKWSWESIIFNKKIVWSDELIKLCIFNIEKTTLNIDSHSRLILIDWESFILTNNLDLKNEFVEKLSDKIINSFKDKYIRDKWYILSSICLTQNLILKYINNWDWNELSKNERISWSIDLIDLFEDRLSWYWLSENTKLLWSEEFISNHEGKWNWNNLSYNDAIPWSENLIKKYEDKLDWKILSNNKSVNISFKFIEEYKNKWNWHDLSMNPSLPSIVKFIEKFGNDYSNKFSRINDLFAKEDIPINIIEVLNEKNLVDWKSLSRNSHLSWNNEFINKYKFKWHIPSLIANSAIPNNLDFIEIINSLSWGSQFQKTIYDSTFREQLFQKCFNELTQKEISILIESSLKTNRYTSENKSYLHSYTSGELDKLFNDAFEGEQDAIDEWEQR